MARRNRGTWQDDDEPFINQEVVDRTNWIVDDDVLLHDDTFKVDDRNLEEVRHLSELYRVVNNMDKKELAICVGVAAEKYPFMVMQCVAESVMRIREGHK